MLKLKEVSFGLDEVWTEPISFHLEKGDFFVLFGPDDSGKTELLHTLLGLRGRYKGEVEFCEHRMRKLSIAERKKIRFVPDEILMLSGVKVKKYFKSLAKTYHIKDKSLIQELTEYFEIDTREYLTEMTYEGNKLVSIIGALMTSPELLILDEPFNFLSEEMSEKLRLYLKKRCEDGMTLLLAVEHFEDANEYANSYFYLRDGEPVQEGRVPVDWIPPKKLVIRKAKEDVLRNTFGEPDEIERDAWIYIKEMSWEQIGKEISSCNIEKNVTVTTARMEEILDVTYPPELEENETLADNPNEQENKQPGDLSQISNEENNEDLEKAKLPETVKTEPQEQNVESEEYVLQVSEETKAVAKEEEHYDDAKHKTGI